MPQPTPGPETITWRRAGDARVIFAAGYALLLQVSHPTVGAGVSEHSQFRSDPWGRLVRTLDYACTMVYAGPEAAAAMGARIRTMHASIKGRRPDGASYHALEPHAYAWVHATLAEGIVRAHERFGRPFSEREREELWREWRALGPLLGIRPRELPADWSAFRVYFEEIVQTRLERTEAVAEVLEALARPAAPASLPWPARSAWGVLAERQLGHFLRLTTVGLLPPLLRQRFGLGWSALDELELGALSLTLRSCTPLMAPSLRNTGPGYLRRRGDAIDAIDAA